MRNDGHNLNIVKTKVGISSPLFLSTRQKVQRIAALLPRRLQVLPKYHPYFSRRVATALSALIFGKYRQNLNEKLERVERLGEGVQEGKRWEFHISEKDFWSSWVGRC